LCGDPRGQTIGDYQGAVQMATRPVADLEAKAAATTPKQAERERKYQAARQTMAKAAFMFVAAYADALDSCPGGLPPGLKNVNPNVLRSFFLSLRGIKRAEDLL
jgi:hypothetical protein